MRRKEKTQIEKPSFLPDLKLVSKYGVPTWSKELQGYIYLKEVKQNAKI